MRRSLLPRRTEATYLVLAEFAWIGLAAGHLDYRQRGQRPCPVLLVEPARARGGSQSQGVVAIERFDHETIADFQKDNWPAILTTGMGCHDLDLHTGY